MKIILNSVFMWRIPVALTLFLFTPILAQWQTVLTIEAEDFVASTAGTAVSDGWVLPDSGRIADSLLAVDLNSKSLRNYTLAGGLFGFGIHLLWHSSTETDLFSSGPHAIQGTVYTLVGAISGVLFNLAIKLCQKTYAHRCKMKPRAKT